MLLFTNYLRNYLFIYSKTRHIKNYERYINVFEQRGKKLLANHRLETQLVNDGAIVYYNAQGA